MESCSIPSRPESVRGVYDVDASLLASVQGGDIAGGRHLLGVTLFDKVSRIPSEIPLCSVAFRHDVTQRVNAEIYHSNRPVQYERHGALTAGHDGETLFGVYRFPDPKRRLDEATRQAYGDIFQLIDRLAYPFLYRIWNYLPAINGTDRQGLERYQAFCKGRAYAFLKDRGHGETFLPAGTGIGCLAEPTQIAFLASRRKNRVNLENPRQVPAYHYPRQYGPQSPSFARATWVTREHGGGEIYVSGTSSVVGHATLHPGDVAKQCQTALDNIELLLAQKNLARYGIERQVSLRDLDLLRIYVRRAKDYPTVRAICEQRLARDAPILYLGADICRADLLMELEGRVRWRPPA